MGGGGFVMKIEVIVPKYSFSLEFDRNISILRGDSGDGKSLLCTLLEQSQEDGSIQVKGDNFVVMPHKTINSTTSKPWDVIINDSHNSIIFVDEVCDCLRDGKFSGKIKQNDNFFVIISRRDYSDLPYSMFAIYTLTKGMDGVVRNTKLYREVPLPERIDSLVTEDSGAGNLYYSRLFNKQAIPAGSKTKIRKKTKVLMAQGYEHMLLTVDAAAFGPEISLVSALLTGTTNSIYAPESFEWVLLHATKFKVIDGIDDLLNDYLPVVDWSKFYSAERFFTAVCKQAFQVCGFEEYDKSTSVLNDTLLSEDSISTVRNELFKTYTYTHADFSTDVELLLKAYARRINPHIWFDTRYPSGANNRAEVLQALDQEDYR